ncbi:MAG TPA: hypothetical protein VFT87_05845 [Candidatus Saccharimonadales bacterium]|nr:hypothetical protein [Candidatus Saccharimonadales bacterium]
MMDQDNQVTCGCYCAACKRGDHEPCDTGVCKWQKTNDDEDE